MRRFDSGIVTTWENADALTPHSTLRALVPRAVGESTFVRVMPSPGCHADVDAASMVPSVR